MNCLAHIIKYILFVSNLIFLICGILLIVFGSLTITSLKDFLTFTEANSLSLLPISVLILGCIIFVIAFLGCCGAIKDNRCLVNSYCICMLILLLLQIALIVYAWFASKNILESMGIVVDKAWDLQQTEPAIMDALQLGYKCCGKNGPADYMTTIPNSCCGSLNNICELSNAHTAGCRAKFLDFWGSSTNLIKYAGMGVAAVELTALVLGWFLSSSIKVSQSEKRTY